MPRAPVVYKTGKARGGCCFNRDPAVCKTRLAFVKKQCKERNIYTSGDKESKAASKGRRTLWRSSMSFVTVPGLPEVSEPTRPSSDAENHTMPHRDTVASVAYWRLSTWPTKIPASHTGKRVEGKHANKNMNIG